MQRIRCFSAKLQSRGLHAHKFHRPLSKGFFGRVPRNTVGFRWPCTTPALSGSHLCGSCFRCGIHRLTNELTAPIDPHLSICRSGVSCDNTMSTLVAGKGQTIKLREGPDSRETGCQIANEGPLYQHVGCTVPLLRRTRSIDDFSANLASNVSLPFVLLHSC